MKEKISSTLFVAVPTIFVAGPEEGVVMFDSKTYIVDYITNKDLKIGDYVMDKWGHCYISEIMDSDNGYYLFIGREVPTSDVRDIQINKILDTINKNPLINI